MRICVWSGSSFEQSYASYHLMEGIINALLDCGYEVHLLQKKVKDGAMPENLEHREKLHVINVPWVEPEHTNFAKRYLDSIMYYRESGKRVKEIHADVVFLQSNNVAIIPIRVAKRLKLPVVYNVQDIFPMDAAVVGKLSKVHPAFIVSRWMQRQAYKMADRVVTISEDLATTIRREGREKVDVVYNWSYRNEPYRIEDEKNHFLNKYGIKREDGFRVVYAGNVGQMMNAELLVQTAVRLRKHEEIKFYIIGTGSNVAFLKRRVEEEGLNNVLLYPPQPMEYAPDNYCMADVNINPVPRGVMYTCMPSKTNTCLLSLKPTVVSMDLDSDMAKKLSNVDQWTVVAPDDADAMAAAILKQYRSSNWNVYSKDAGAFMSKLGPVENAYEYVRILEEASGKDRT